MTKLAKQAEVIAHLNGDDPKDTDRKPLVLVITPIPFLSAVGTMPLPIRLYWDLPHFNLELSCSTGSIPNPLLEFCTDMGMGISCMHLSTMVHLCLN